MACIVNSIMVTTEAMIKTNTGSLTSLRTKPLISETIVFDSSSVISVAIPRPTPFTTVLVTASNGQSPSSCTRATLLLHRPLREISSLLVMSCHLIKNHISVLLIVQQCIAYCSDYRARRDGCAGKLVEIPAITFYQPALLAR